ncbi:MAG: KH domain-containing protein [Clostridia bacterium]|nr:KH domain-containing protein [Clostridia bacterium]
MKDLLLFIVKALVDEPERVNITEIDEAEDSVLFEIRVAESDMGKVIGKQGRIAKAIRTVMKSAANKEHKKVTVDIKE